MTGNGDKIGKIVEGVPRQRETNQDPTTRHGDDGKELQAQCHRTEATRIIVTRCP